MISISLPFELVEMADESLWRTNTVWCMERVLRRREMEPAAWAHLPHMIHGLVEQFPRYGLRLPRHAIDRWRLRFGLPNRLGELVEAPEPGVIGLVVDAVNQDALVVPLAASHAGEWSVDPTLPFESGALQDLLLQLLHSLDHPHVRGVPERFAFSISDSLGRRSSGRSMDIAGLLTVIREANRCPPMLDRACAVVQPDGDRLASVGRASLKLEAFVREFGSGGLLVKHPDCRDSKPFERHFDVVWETMTICDLATRLDASGLLAVFQREDPLSLREASVVLGRIRHYQEVEHRHAEALALADRCRLGSDVPARLGREYVQCRIDLTRILGNGVRSVGLVQEARVLTAGSPADSYEDQALADVNLAAALHSLHRFEEICTILGEWRVRLSRDPLLLTPLTRVKILNTLGRAMVVLEQDGWEELFCESASIMSHWEPGDVARTWCYMAHGLLRTGRLEEAEHWLGRIETFDQLDDATRRFYCAHRADLARRRGEIWSDDALEDESTAGPFVHPIAYYCLATARQPGRDLGDSAFRMRRAVSLLTQGLRVGENQENVRRFLIDCIQMTLAALSGNESVWREAINPIREKLASDENFKRHYGRWLLLPVTGPSRADAELLLDQIPFF